MSIRTFFASNNLKYAVDLLKVDRVAPYDPKVIGKELIFNYHNDYLNDNFLYKANVITFDTDEQAKNALNLIRE